MFFSKILWTTEPIYLRQKTSDIDRTCIKKVEMGHAPSLRYMVGMFFNYVPLKAIGTIYIIPIPPMPGIPPPIGGCA